MLWSWICRGNRYGSRGLGRSNSLTEGRRTPRIVPPRARNRTERGGVMSLSDWRRRIDEIDRKLVELLNERSRCAIEIGKLKQVANIPLYQPERELEVLANAEN